MLRVRCSVFGVQCSVPSGEWSDREGVEKPYYVRTVGYAGGPSRLQPAASSIDDRPGVSVAVLVWCWCGAGVVVDLNLNVDLDLDGGSLA